MEEPRLEGLARTYLTREGVLYTCTICGKTGTHNHAMKMHLESKHFPTEGGYACDLCARVFNTKNAFKTHKSNQHKLFQ